MGASSRRVTCGAGSTFARRCASCVERQESDRYRTPKLPCTVLRRLGLKEQCRYSPVTSRERKPRKAAAGRQRSDHGAVLGGGQAHKAGSSALFVVCQITVASSADL